MYWTFEVRALYIVRVKLFVKIRINIQYIQRWPQVRVTISPDCVNITKNISFHNRSINISLTHCLDELQKHHPISEIYLEVVHCPTVLSLSQLSIDPLHIVVDLVGKLWRREMIFFMSFPKNSREHFPASLSYSRGIYESTKEQL